LNAPAGKATLLQLLRHLPKHFHLPASQAKTAQQFYVDDNHPQHAQSAALSHLAVAFDMLMSHRHVCI
jgi:hypothetical protein